MICLPSQLPLLRFGNFEVVQYDARWLADSIMAAAERAGHEDWWIADDIAKGIIEYLRQRFPGNTITVEELYEKISRALDVLGWDDVAGELQVGPPPLRISLAEIAQEAGDGFELAFFRLLRERLAETCVTGSQQIQCYGLRKGVKILHRARRWGNRCQCLAEEIAEFLRAELRAYGCWTPEMSLVLR
ncbi:MAG: hypothetical protein ACI8XO_003584 [Verrucomicrobiales bacterium]|jgi:hypothetical protein